MRQSIFITVNGTKKDEIVYDLIEMMVDTNVHLPSMFRLDIQDYTESGTGKLKYIDSEMLNVGSEIKIEMETDSNVMVVLINGEITAIEPIFTSDGLIFLRVRGYDKTHRLTRGTITRTFLKMKDSDIFNKVAAECGLSVQSTATTITFDYVIQYNQTNWDFLWSRAKRIGYKIYSQDQKIYFNKIDEEVSGKSPNGLTWGSNLRRFEPRLSLVGQVNESVALGWDPKKKEGIEQKETDTGNVVPSIGLGKNNGGTFAKSTFSAAGNYFSNMPFNDTSEAKAVASGQKIISESTFIQAEGESFGDPRLVAGKKVKVENVGTKFSGEYHVTEAQHYYRNGEYTVTFAVTGQDPNTIHSLLNNNNSSSSNKIDGVVPAIVTNNEDPDNLSRIQVKFPWLPKDNGAEVSSAWARLATPNGGKDRGFYFMPEVDDEVLVAFEHGDINFPYIVGSLWNGKDTTPVATNVAIKSGKVNQRVIKSRSGHIITLDDTDGEEKISIVDKTLKNSIEINSKDKSMTIKAEGDLIFDAGGKFTVTSKGDVVFDSKAKATIKASSEFSVTANSKASIKSGPGELALQSSGTALKGTTVEVNGSAKTDVKSGAMVQIQGAMVKIN